MTEVYLDDIRLDFEDTDGTATLADLTGGVEEQLKGLKRLIIEVDADGEVHTDWKERDLLSRRLKDFSVLRLKTVSTDTVVLQGLSTVREYIDMVGEAISGGVDDIRLGRSGTAETLSATFDGLLEIVRTLEAIARGGGGQGGIPAGDLAGICAPLIGHMEELSGARASGDSVLVADLLEYEIAPFLDELRERLLQGEGP